MKLVNEIKLDELACPPCPEMFQFYPAAKKNAYQHLNAVEHFFLSF